MISGLVPTTVITFSIFLFPADHADLFADSADFYNSHFPLIPQIYTQIALMSIYHNTFIIFHFIRVICVKNLRDLRETKKGN